MIIFNMIEAAHFRVGPMQAIQSHTTPECQVLGLRKKFVLTPQSQSVLL